MNTSILHLRISFHFLMKIFSYSLLGIWNMCVCQVEEYTLKGIVSDQKQQPLPFASIEVAHTHKVTVTNEKGEFELKLPKGTYQVYVQYLGYKKQEVSVVMKQDQEIVVVLEPEEKILQEVAIRAGEDPAYQVIRQAIKYRKKHQRELSVLSYRCHVYIKGVQRLLDFPDKVMGIKVEVNDKDKGIFYLSETKSAYFFFPPNHKKEIIKASRVSGESKGFSFNRYIPMQKDIYENTLDFYFISNRPFISPVSENAFLFYKYRMQGTFYENGKLINKIEVVPKSATEPCFRGMIYIEENTWRVHSFDFYITKEAKLNFIDTLWIKQMNMRIHDSLYYPASIQYLFNFNIFGIKGNGYFIASVSDYVFSIDTLSKKFFKNEMVRFEKEAIKNDSAFWNKERPIPLSDEEKKDYIKKDSIEKVQSSPSFLDSLDRSINKFRFSSVLFGYHYRKTRKHFDLTIDGLLDAGVQYNTIEGINVTLRKRMSKSNENETKKWWWKNDFRYGVANRLFGFKTQFEYADNPFNFRRYGISAQYFVEPFNHEHSIPEILNTAYTLLSYRNYLKIYLKKSWQMFYHQELVNGLYTTVTTAFEERTALANTLSLKIFNKKNYFTSNNPLYPISDSVSFPTHQSFLMKLTLRYYFKQRYTTYPNRKQVWSNRYPVIQADYIKAIPLNNTMTDFDWCRLKIEGSVELKYWGVWKWETSIGKFLNNRRMYFMDYQHFPGNQAMILQPWNTFRILHYYNFSTYDYFAQVHTEYNLRGIILGRIPFIKKYKIEEIVTAHYLYASTLQNYFETSFGIDRLFHVGRVEYALAYYPFMPKPLSQILIGINLNVLNR